MPIKTFELVSIDGKRFSRLGERIPHLRVDNNTAVTNVSSISDKEAQMDFRFTISYVGVGMIKIEDVQSTVTTLLASHGRAAAVPDGPYVIGMVKKEHA